MNFTQRKHPRLKNFDYSQNGDYFVTVCTKNRRPILSVVGRDAHIPPSSDRDKFYITLTNEGKIVEKYIKSINIAYAGVYVEKYVIMPNHIHLLISIRYENSTRKPPELHTIIRSLKTLATKELGYSIWQSSYYDSIIWLENSYYSVVQYIENNPKNWKYDDMYCE